MHRKISRGESFAFWLGQRVGTDHRKKKNWEKYTRLGPHYLMHLRFGGNAYFLFGSTTTAKSTTWGRILRAEKEYKGPKAGSKMGGNTHLGLKGRRKNLYGVAKKGQIIYLSRLSCLSLAERGRQLKDRLSGPHHVNFATSRGKQPFIRACPK